MSHLFGNRVSDLNRAAIGLLAGVGELGRTESRSVDPVTASTATDGNDQVTRLNFLFRFVARDQSDTATKYKRIADVAIVKEDGSVDGRNSHPVSVVTDASNDAFHDRARVHDAGGQVVGGFVGRGKAKHVGIADRFGAEPGSQSVSNHAADSGVRTTIRFQSGRAIMSFDFKGQIEIVVVTDDSRVVFENTHAPIVVAKLGADRLRGGKDRFFEHVLVAARSVFVGVRDATCEGFVTAVFAPSLRDRFQFDVGRVAT